MKKNLFVLLLAVCMVFAAGCQNNPNESSTPSTTAAQEKPLEMNSLYESMAARMPEMLKLDETMMLNYCGIKAEDCVQAVVAICSDGLKTDEVWLLEATDAEALSRLETLANARLKAKAAESETYSPEQYAVVQKAKVILSQNKYLIMIVSPDVDALESIYETAAGLK